MKDQDDSSNLPVPFKSARGSQLPTPVPARFTAEDDSSREGVVAYWRMVMRHEWIVILVVFLGATAGILITLPQTPIYQSTTLVEVQGLNENFLNMQNLNPTCDWWLGLRNHDAGQSVTKPVAYGESHRAA